MKQWKNGRMFILPLSLCLLITGCSAMRPKSVVQTGAGSASVSSCVPVSSFATPSSSAVSSSQPAKSSSTAPSESASAKKLSASAVSDKKTAAKKTATAKTAVSSKNSGKSTAENMATQWIVPCPQNAEPRLLEYQHRLYLTPGIMGVFSKNEYVKPAGLICKIFDGNVCFVQGVDAAQAICLQDMNSRSNYIGYHYLFDDSMQIGGRTYRFVSGRNNSSKSAYGGISDVIPADDANFLAEVDSIDSSPTSDEDYYINLILNNGGSTDKQLAAIMDKAIGTLNGATVYSIDEIDPSQAVMIKTAKNDLFVVAKRYGTTGKTIENVLADKGLNKVY